MREVRAELREDVKELVVSAHEMADWTNYVKAYPWLCVGAALAAGFMIVPSRSVVIKPDAEGLIELAKRHKLVVNMKEQQPAKKRRGIMADLLGMAAAAVLQRGAAVLTQQMTQAFQGGTAPHNGHQGAHHG
jgi:hypothetical protein